MKKMMLMLMLLFAPVVPGQTPDPSLTLPVVVVQRGSRVEFEQKGVPGSSSGELNAGGTELTGTFTQRGVSIPLTFTRGPK
jgi:hypothetical protein